MLTNDIWLEQITRLLQLYSVEFCIYFNSLKCKHLRINIRCTFLKGEKPSMSNPFPIYALWSWN